MYKGFVFVILNN